MIKELNAKLLAQVANDEIADNDILSILASMYNSMPSEDPERLDFDRLSAANCLSKANKSLLDTFKRRIYELLKGPKGNEPCTVTVGTRMFKLYYNTSYTWQNLRLPDKPVEQMTEKELLIKEELEIFNALNEQYSAAEMALNILKQKRKASEETLAALMPTSKCIHRTPVVQVV